MNTAVLTGTLGIILSHVVEVTITGTRRVPSSVPEAHTSTRSCSQRKKKVVHHFCRTAVSILCFPSRSLVELGDLWKHKSDDASLMSLCLRNLHITRSRVLSLNTRTFNVLLILTSEQTPSQQTSITLTTKSYGSWSKPSKIWMKTSLWSSRNAFLSADRVEDVKKDRIKAMRDVRTSDSSNGSAFNGTS